MNREITVLITCFLLSTAARAEQATEALPDFQPFAQVRAIGELGFLGAVAHTIQYSKDGTKFDYVNEGGQNNLFLFGRLSAELELDGHHTVVLLYQPLRIPTAVTMRRDVRVDGLTFPEGMPVDLVYGFDFYRISYLYDFWGDSARHELSLGTSMQIRNADIRFTSADGTLRRANRDLGPVPTLKFRARYGFDGGAWIATEIDAVYAPIKYLNGGDSDVEGALFDVNLRAGLRVYDHLDAFINLRYLAGGAEGTSDVRAGGDGFVANWLQFVTVSLGVEFNLFDPA